METEDMAQALNLEGTEVALNVKREAVSKIKGLKFSSNEIPRVETFQEYLYDRGFLPENSFAALFIYLFNLGYTLHKQVADTEAEEEKYG